MLDHSLEVLQAGNNREACRANIVDDKYWEIEANHYKTWLDSNILWENLKSLEREHDTQFYTEIGGLGWARTHAEVLSKAVGMEKHHRVVFDVLYHKHRANYWKRVCRDNGSLCTRMDIQESYYWETEFSHVLNELQKVEKEVSRRTVAAHLRKENKSMHSNTARGRDQSKVGKIYNLRRRIVKCS